MTKKKADNQNVAGKEGVIEEPINSATESNENANMTDEKGDDADTVAEAPAVEEVDWKDKYLRLQAVQAPVCLSRLLSGLESFLPREIAQ